MKLFGKNTAVLTLGTALMALVGKETVTAEEATAANTELEGLDIKGAQLITEAAFNELSEKAGRVDAAEKSKTDADKKVLELTEANTKLTTDYNAEKKRADELAKTPGAESTTPVRVDGKTDIEEEPSDAAANQKIVDDLHAKMLGDI